MPCASLQIIEKAKQTFLLKSKLAMGPMRQCIWTEWKEKGTEVVTTQSTFPYKNPYGD